MSASRTFWALIPAAGSARRMGANAVPKQYLPLHGRTVLEWALAPFLGHVDCAGAVVVLAADDAHWIRLGLAQDARIATAIGGAERAASVLAGLTALRGRAAPDDWVLVHDAARPCLSGADLAQLLDAVRADDMGGLLAAPVTDTLKQSTLDGRVAKTVSRDQLWRALTPQMFRYEVLERALSHAAGQGLSVTDEAQAIELLGLHPRLVAGSADNLKITVPEDLRRAEQILAMRSDATVSPVP